LLITNNQNENSKKILLVVMSLAILIVGGVLYGFYLKPKYDEVTAEKYSGPNNSIF
jgi:Tfp pilus assembly protein PilO